MLFLVRSQQVLWRRCRGLNNSPLVITPINLYTSYGLNNTPGPSYSAHHSPEYIHASLREIAGVMDAICSLAATQAAQDQRLAQCHSMLTQIMTRLGLPHVPGQREEPTTDAASLDVLAAAATVSDPPPPQQ